MSGGRTIAAGATRSCPHCRATVLERALKCPQCQKHLRFDPNAATKPVRTMSPFRVEATIQPPERETWEYNLLVIVRDARGAELSRHLVNVGALAPGEARAFELAVEVETG